MASESVDAHFGFDFIAANLSARSKNLKKHLRDVIQQEIDATDERVRRFTEHQSALLKIYREKAEQDYQDIIRYGNDDLFAAWNFNSNTFGRLRTVFEQI